MEQLSSGHPCNDREGPLDECRAEAILRGMDALLVGIVDFQPTSKTVGSPEREVHIDQERSALLMKSRYDGLESSISCSKTLGIACQTQNPEDTAPMNVTCDTVSLLSSSASSNSMRASGSKTPLTEQRDAFLFGDDESEVSLLLDEETAPTGSDSFVADEESIVCIQDAVDAIREEASRVEAALAIAKLQALQSEHRSLNQLVEAQTDQIEQLKKELKRRDDKIAMMDLERDLWQADMDALRESQRALPSKSVMRKELNSPMESLTSLSISVKDRKVDCSLSSGATLASSEGGTETGKKVCEASTGDGALEDVTRFFTSVSTKRLDIDSPLESVSSGGSIALERYLCNLNLEKLQEERRKLPLSSSDGAPMATVTVASNAGGNSHTNSSLSGLSATSNLVGNPSVSQEDHNTGIEISLAVKNKTLPLAVKVSRLDRCSNARKDEALPLGGKNKKSNPLVNRKDAAGNMKVPAASKTPGVECIALEQPKTECDSFHRIQVQVNPVSQPEDGSYHSASQGSSQGSSKENRVANIKKRPSQFKPIQPGNYHHASPIEKIHAPIPRKAQSTLTPIKTDQKSTDGSIMSNSDSRRPASGTPVARPTFKQSSERHLFGRFTVDRSGAFPTDDNARDSTKDGEGEHGTNKKQKSGVSIFLRKRSDSKNAGRSQNKEATKRDSVSSKCLEGRDSLQIQVEELAQRLRTSVEGSEDLRKRLAMISRYYETTVQRLSENIVSLKQEQVAMQGDLTKQIKSIDRERLVAMKRTELLLKEQQIAKFKKKQRKRF